MTGDKTGEPKGVTMVLIGPDGRIVAHASDFHPGTSAGLGVREVQEMRARRALFRNAVTAMCNADMAASIKDHQAEEIVHEMQRQKRYAIQTLVHGHAKDG